MPAPRTKIFAIGPKSTWSRASLGLEAVTEPAPLNWKYGLAGVFGLLLLAVWAASLPKAASPGPPKLEIEVPVGSPPLNLQSRQAWQRLAVSQRFVTREGCFGTEPPSEFRSWDRMRSSPHAETLFAELCRQGSGAALLYGLAGLAAMDSALYPGFSQRAQNDERALFVDFGFFGGEATVAQALKLGPVDAREILSDLRLGEYWELEFSDTVMASLAEASVQQPM